MSGFIEDYWSIEYNGKRFYNVLDAASELKENFKHAYLNFYDKPFSKYDWSVEPSETFEQLKAERARQLRDQYNYLRLYASFASDSGTMINAFVNNNLHIDEIVNFATIYGKELPEFDQERITLTIPSIQNFLKITSKTKIVLKDIGVNEVVSIMKVRNKNASNPLPSRHNVTDISHDLQTNKFVVDVHGDLKPFFTIEAGQFWTGFNLPYVHDMLSRGAHSENFFTTHKFPLLHIKQCHMLKNKIKKEKPELVRLSWLHPVLVAEPARFSDGSLMETFIEDACRDFNDFGRTPIKSFDVFAVKGTLQYRDLKRIQGFYLSAKQELSDYIDFVREYFNSHLFEKVNGVTVKNTLNYKKYSLGF